MSKNVLYKKLMVILNSVCKEQTVLGRQGMPMLFSFLCWLDCKPFIPKCSGDVLPWYDSASFLLREIPGKLFSFWRLGGEERGNWKLKEGYYGLEQAKVLGYTGIASLDLSGLLTSTCCCSSWRREIASPGYVVGFGKGFSTAFVMF